MAALQYGSKGILREFFSGWLSEKKEEEKRKISKVIMQ
jgi:hypothetical protein